MRPEELFDFEALLPAAVAVALQSQRWPEFFDWLREALPGFAAPQVGLAKDEHLRRALSSAMGRALWNALPLPRNGFLPERVPEPGRNDSCPCGSGEKFKRCCAGAPPLSGFTPAMLWPHVLAALRGPARRAALASHHVPRAAFGEFAARELEAGRPAVAAEVLAPHFQAVPPHDDDIAAAMMTTLCNAYDALGTGPARKLALLQRVSALPGRSPLRSDAWQRLACIHMDRDESAQAWQAFRHAQQDNPVDPALGMLEAQLLLAEGKTGLARERARFHLGQLRRRGNEVDSELLEFYESMARDPGRAMADVAIESEGGAGRRLAAWIERIAQRPLPAYALASEPVAGTDGDLLATLRARLQQMGVRGAELERAAKDMQRQVAAMQQESPGGKRAGGKGRKRAAAVSRAPAGPPSGEESPRVLQPPADIAALYPPWREVFTLDKPFSVHPLPFDAGDVWASGIEAGWSAFLEAHPEAADSLDILDDLATAVALHPQGDRLPVAERLALPLLERARAIVEAALARIPGSDLCWEYTPHRPALRALVRLMELESAREHAGRARELLQRMLALNPGDNHGLRYRLATDLLHDRDDAGCLQLAARYPDDVSPELRFNEALAHYRLGQAKSAIAALRRAHELNPAVVRFLLPARVRKPKLSERGVSLGGDDQAWLYRDSMRALWRDSPGALEWAKKVLGPAAARR